MGMDHNGSSSGDKAVRQGSLFLRAALFVLLLILVLAASSRILKTEFENTAEMAGGFYAEEDDSLEVVFIGSSLARNAFIPSELYEDYGIVSYNLSTSGQPVLGSYWWLNEAYAHHAESLRTVVFEVSSLRRQWEPEKYRVALSDMEISAARYHAVRDIADDLDGFLEYMVPLISYHTRWKELDADDYSLSLPGDEDGMRGYWASTRQLIADESYDLIRMPLYKEDPSAGMAGFGEEELLYFERICLFCREHGIRLILAKTPSISWEHSEHNAASALAGSWGLTFLDFNYTPYIEEIDYNRAADSSEGHHLNYYGASKLTGWFGRYLTETGAASDQRGLASRGSNKAAADLDRYRDAMDAIFAGTDEEYGAVLDIASESARMLGEGMDPEDLEGVYREFYLYSERLRDYYKAEDLRGSPEGADFISYLREWLECDHSDDYIILIAGQGDVQPDPGSVSMEELKRIGLAKLAGISAGGTYAAVIDSGRVIAEESQAEVTETLIELLGYIRVESAGASGGEGAFTDISIWGAGFSPGRDGLNVVVYNKETDLPADTAVFEPGSGLRS